MQTQIQRRVRELNSRTNDGLQVRLLWCATDGYLFVEVEDQKTGERFSIPVGEQQAPLEVFNHPYAYQPADHH